METFQNGDNHHRENGNVKVSFDSVRALISDKSGEPKKRSTIKGIKPVCSQRISLGTSAIALFFSIAVLIVFIVRLQQNNYGMRTEIVTGFKPASFPSGCIDCRKVVKNTYDLSDPDQLLDRLTKRFDDSVLVCCWDNPQQISAILQAIVREQDVQTASASTVALESVSAHKNMISPQDNALMKEITSHPEYSKTTFKFNPNKLNPLTEHVRGVTIMKEGLVIHHTGYYFVYGSISFGSAAIKHKTKRNIQDSTNHITQRLFRYIYRTSPNSPSNTGVLLQSGHTVCVACKESSKSSFTGGVFLLKAGDFLQMFISVNDQVIFTSQSSYMGLVMLGKR
uniref:THD domain-containing protein n=1 Tax=Arion vulgaris TaxID=1028688 RepID=A0A0B6ZNU1_9EUPU